MLLKWKLFSNSFFNGASDPIFEVTVYDLILGPKRSGPVLKDLDLTPDSLPDRRFKTGPSSCSMASPAFGMQNLDGHHSSTGS